MYFDIYKITDMLTSKSTTDLFNMKQLCHTLEHDMTNSKRDRKVYAGLAKLIKDVLLKNH